MCIQKVLHMYVISAYSKNVCKSTFVQYLLAYNIQTNHIYSSYICGSNGTNHYYDSYVDNVTLCI